MSARPDLRVDRLVEVLTRHGVDFVVVGGIAAVLHGSARNTYDLDVCFATDAANLEALGAALVELDAKLRGVADDVPFVPDAAALRRVVLLTLRTTAGDLDVMVRPDGAPDYATLRGRADAFDLGGVRVLVASIDDLMAMKLAAGRDKDRLDLAELQAIDRLRREVT